MYLFGALDKPIRETLAMRGLSWLGEFSFSLYVVHLPVFVLLGSVFFRSALQTDIWASFGFTAVAVCIAFGFHFAVEQPAMVWSASLKQSRRGA